MNIVRSKPTTLHSSALSIALGDLHGPCVGCEGCNGLCAELIDALVLPEVILSKKRESS